MLDTPVFETSAPLILGAEGMSLPFGDIQTIPTEDIRAQDQVPNYSANLNNVFNTSTLNTPEIEDFTFNGNFEEFFTWNDLGQAAIENFEQIKDTLTENTDFSQPENIWGFKTFDEDNIEFCAPPSIVEGNVENQVDEHNMTSNVTTDIVGERYPESTFHIEDNDVLKWIIDDQQIDDIPILENSLLKETQAFESIPLSDKSKTTEFILQELVLPVKVEVKTEDLGEDEKYRKMRIQNNEASRKCRQNRKRKQQDMEEECKILEERNFFLKSRLEEMEQEVKAWKKKLLTDIASTSQNKQF